MTGARDQRFQKAARRHANIDQIRARRLPRGRRAAAHARASQALAVAAAAGVGIAALVWWARQQKKDSELDDEADAPPPAKTEEAAPKDAATGEAVKAEFNACKQKAFELFKASPPRYAEAAEWFSKARRALRERASEENSADLLTKPLDVESHWRHLESLGLGPPPERLAEESPLRWAPEQSRASGSAE